MSESTMSGITLSLFVTKICAMPQIYWESNVCYNNQMFYSKMILSHLLSMGICNAWQFRGDHYTLIMSKTPR